MSAWVDEEEDDLQRILEGRDYDDDQQAIDEFILFKESVELETSQKNFHKALKKTTHQQTEKESENEEEEDEEIIRNNADDEAIEVPATKTKAKIRRIVKNPRPKLDVDKLKSARGIVALPNYFNNVKFKGRGYEKDDLNRLMLGIEHWANRLMPSLSFDDFIEKCESLGQKRQVQTFMTKLRLDLPLDTINEDKQNGDEELEYIDFTEDTYPKKIDPEAAFDKILENDLLKENTTQQASEKEAENNVNSKQTLSEEQLKIIEEKRLRAIQLRQKRLQKFDPNYSTMEDKADSEISSSNCGIPIIDQDNQNEGIA